ncbi:site-specific integrase [Dinoroseobacter sp. PD6]|uniref:site-specific integrase n=1 Tax=Dinoroseobacter sp. PD6 TaxID=3028384 RepID=UPI00237BA390|nr:site-specific integrase [Dinoroseobacter sp. PD6]MDD9718738.1 site-specific integrase [Dinoroseobacter sp. PD6]
MNVSFDRDAVMAAEIVDELLRSDAAPQDWTVAIETAVAERGPELGPKDRNHIVNYAIERVNDRLGLSLKKTHLQRPPAPIAPLRNAEWPGQAMEIIHLRHRLDEILTVAGRSTPGADLPRLLLASAALRGGLGRLEGLQALARAVGSGELTLNGANAFPGLVWIDLDLRISREAQQHTNKDPGKEYLRWFPDVTSLALIDRWRRLGPLPYDAPSSASALYTDMLELLGVPETKAMIPAHRFPLMALAALEYVSGIALPVSVQAVASGQSVGLSVLPETWDALCTRGQPLKEPPDTRGAARTAQPQPSRTPKSAAPCPSPADHAKAQLLEALKECLDTHAATSSVKGRKAMSDALQTLQQEAVGIWHSLEALVSWYRTLLRNGDKPRTVKDYHSIVGRHVLAVMTEDDPRNLTPEALRDMFEQVLARSSYANPAHPLGRLAHFARHAERVLDWPDADFSGFGDQGKGSATFVRTAALPMAIYPEVFDAILQTTDLSPDMAECYAVAFALVAWGGLRIDEAHGRVVDDIGTDLTVFVHATSGHGLKSEAARRLIPLALFAPPEVVAQVKSFVARRATVPDKTRDKLLDLGTLFPGDRFDTGTFRTLLQRTLGQMLGIAVRPHDFRHTLISALQLLFHLGADAVDTIEAVSGWNAKRQKRIRHALLGVCPDPRRAPRQISALAGHRDLSAISGTTYCHLTDLALGRLIQSAEERLPASVAARWLGLNRRSLRPFIDDNDTVRLEDLRGPLVNKMDIAWRTTRTGQLPSPEPRVAKPVRVTPTVVHAVLKMAEHDTDTLTIADQLNIMRDQVTHMLATAEDLMAATTQKKGARHVGAHDQDRPNWPVARFADQPGEVRFLARLLADAETLPPENMLKWSMVVLTHADRHRPCLRFLGAPAAQNWLELFPKAFPKSSLDILIRFPSDVTPEAAEKAWCTAIGAKGNYQTESSGHGTSVCPTAPGLIMLRKVSKKAKESRSFSTLRRAAFCIAVTCRVTDEA